MNLRVRKKKNASGSISVQILDRTNRGYKVVETIGCSSNDLEIEQLYEKALQRINELAQNLFANKISESNKKILLKELLSNLTMLNLTSHKSSYEKLLNI